MYFIISGTKKNKIGHRHRSSLNFRGQDIFAPKIYMINKIPEFYMILARKISPNLYDICPKNEQSSRILHDFCPKNARIYIIIA